MSILLYLVIFQHRLKVLTLGKFWMSDFDMCFYILFVHDLCLKLFSVQVKGHQVRPCGFKKQILSQTVFLKYVQSLKSLGVMGPKDNLSFFLNWYSKKFLEESTWVEHMEVKNSLLSPCHFSQFVLDLCYFEEVCPWGDPMMWESKVHCKERLKV